MTRPTLYLDFDGPLHPAAVYSTPWGPELRMGDWSLFGKTADACAPRLFMHTPHLEAALARYARDIDVVLSTSWAWQLGYEAALERLPASISGMCRGATWEPECEALAVATWRRQSRYEQIRAHARRHRIVHWLALDDDNDCWPEAEYDKLILCDGRDGLGAPETRAALASGLHLLTSRDVL